MTDYNAYRAEKGISRGEMISALRPHYSKYNKTIQSFVERPDVTGVCLLPDAEYHLVDIYGFGTGLSIIDDGSYQPKHLPPPTKKKPKRTKPHSYTIRFDSELNEAVRQQMARLNISTMQQYVEEAVSFFVQCGLGEG